MSQLIDKLNQVAKVTPQAMGFKTIRPVMTKPKLLLIARLAQANITDRRNDYTASADAVLFTGLIFEPQAAKKSAGFPTDVPWGVYLEDMQRKGIAPMVDAGCDFVVFPADMALATTVTDKVGKVLQIEPSTNEGLLRTVNELPVDAVLLDDVEKEKRLLTWHHLMLFQRLADLLTKPLLTSIPANMTDSELQFLWKTGVDGVVVNVETGQSAGGLKTLRQIIDRLTFPPRPRKKLEALLPHIGEGKGPITEVEEDEEEEEYDD